MKKYRASKNKLLENKLLINKLAQDFVLEDVWEFPITFKQSEKHSLYAFGKKAIQPIIVNFFNSTLAGFLFKFRGIIGKVFKIDETLNSLPIPGCKEISLAERMDENEKMKHNPELDIDLSSNNFLNFRLVYAFENETLHELSNKTEHALMHFAFVKVFDDSYKVYMSAFVKHRSFISKFYMALIRPFRHYIVYPYMINECVRLWSHDNSSSN